VAFKKKDRNDKRGDQGSNVAVDDAAPRGGAGTSGGGIGGPSSLDEALLGSVATAQAVRVDSDSDSDSDSHVLADSNGRTADKVATPFKGRLGDILTEGNLISQEQLELALAQQRESGGKLGEVLVGMGFLDARALADALAEVLGLEVLNLRRENVESDALALVPEAVARTQLAIPVRFEGNYLQIAVAEPSEEVRALLAKTTGRDVQLMLAPMSDVIWAIDSNYRAIGSVGKLVQAFEPSKARASATSTTPNRSRRRRRAGRPGRRPHLDPGDARPGLGRPHRTVRRHRARALPHRRRAERRSCSCPPRSVRAW
jgi:hypothetical protein